MDFRLIETNWDGEFATATVGLQSELRIITPFLQLKAVQSLASRQLDVLGVITRFNLDDLCAGVSDIEALEWLLIQGADIRGIRNLHSKAYLFDKAFAIVTSANLTNAALIRNHELGFAVTHPKAIAECHGYFDRLWSQARPLDSALLKEMRSRIDNARRKGGCTSNRPTLGDMGASVGLPPPPSATRNFPLGGTAYIKFFGINEDRASHAIPILQEIQESGSHWACTYKAARRLNDGDTMFLGRLVKDPNDIMIYGRAVACRHDPTKDFATLEDISRRPWKADWPKYVRVHDSQFLKAPLSSGVSLRALVTALGERCFASTEMRALQGDTQINPLLSLRQKPDVRLSESGKQWVNQQLEAAFAQHGQISEAEMVSLDWPSV